MSSTYYLRTKKCDFTGIARQTGVDPVIIRLMLNRDVPPERMQDFLCPSVSDLHDPHLLPDVEKGAQILLSEIEGAGKIRIIGDYDVDGICSTYILLCGLKALGADVDYRIPERERHGYGLNAELIDLALKDGRQVILTCDNGISETSSIARAKSYGMTVIVTDHHNVPETLPLADALIDPKIRTSDGVQPYPFSEICGAVVAMKFLQVLYEKAGRSASEPLRYLELAAFATVCDVMPLKDENRPIVREGLIRIRRTENAGLKALMQVCEIRDVKAWHFGFILGPCLNAAGRLKTAEEAMKLLLAESDSEARRQAHELRDLNERRKALTEQGISQALSLLPEEKEKMDRVLVIHLSQCPDSIAGIIAGKIRERVYRPVFIISGNGSILKGSARSIPGYSLFDEMTKISDVFEKFGGHPLAAGFSVRYDRIDEMRSRLNENCSLTPHDLTEKKYIDANMPMSYVTIPLLEQIDLLEPFGTANPSPLFAEHKPVLVQARRIGKERNYLRFTVRTADGFRTQAVYFGNADDFLQSYRKTFGESEAELLLSGRGRQKVSFTYKPQISVFHGETSVSYKIDDFIFGR